MKPEKMLDFLTFAGRLRWRLVLMAYLCAEEYPGIDLGKLLTFAAIHDLGEAVTGDIPAFVKTEAQEQTEDRAIDNLVNTLPTPAREKLSALFDEYERQDSLEAKLCLALDKMEALLSHNESDIATWLPLEYDLQLTYGAEEAAFSPYTEALRAALNNDTRRKIAEAAEK